MAPAGFVRPGLVFLCLFLALAAPAQASGKKGEVGLGVHFGGASYDNDQFNDDLESIGWDRIESGVEYGFSVDYRLSRWFSVAAVATRMGGTSSPPPGTPNPQNAPTYDLHASPIAFGVVVHPLGSKHANLDVFGGIGPLLNATVAQSSNIFEFQAHKTGVYWHGGVTAEYRFSPMVAISLSGLARHAEAKNLDLRARTGDPEARWDLAFNGAAVWFGPRLYFGNTEE
jgi:hypothetical protein